MSWSRAGLIVALAASLAACGEDPPKEPVAQKWQLLGADRPEAMLSVVGTSTSDVWVVGADKGAGPVVLHWDGAAWEKLTTGSRGDLWWVLPFAGGPVYMAGSGATLLRYENGAFTRMAAPGVARNTVYGIWGKSPDDVYAVGSVAAHSGFVWHYDGQAWTELRLPANLPHSEKGETPGLFKVWGTGDDVWFVGSLGTILHRHGTADLEAIQVDTEERFFTVHGDADHVVVVGDSNGGVLLERQGDRWVSKAPGVVPLLQGVCLGKDGKGYATGAEGAVYTRSGDSWKPVKTGLKLDVQSLHAVWVDPEGGAWAVGGNVLDSNLDKGALIHTGKTVSLLPDPPKLPDPDTSCPAAAIDPKPDGSIARRWNEQVLNAIRRDVPRPGVHARNLFHLAAAMYDAWAAYDATAVGYLDREKLTAADVQAARTEAISYAAYRVLAHRYEETRAAKPGYLVSQSCFTAFMAKLGYDPADTIDSGSTPRALGNRIGQMVIDHFAEDGANEAKNYADTTDYKNTGGMVNPPLTVDTPSTVMKDPSVWQPLVLAQAATQNGIPLDAGVQGYIGPQWGHVAPFAMTGAPADGVYHDPGPAPTFGPELRGYAVDVLMKESQLDATDGDTIDISPGAYGNNSLGSNDGHGRPENPVTGEPYPPQVVPLGDFGRVLAEFWADGPTSETPPGHWNTIANHVVDSPGFERKLGGTGASLDPLEWDVKMYFAVDGAVHDAAVAAWGIKRKTLTSRPISLIRYMAMLGQSSEPSAPDYAELGLPLVPGTIERITAESSAPGERHADLAQYVGELAVRAWRGEPGDRKNEIGGVGWIRAKEWIPYQRRTFVTPAFPGFVSGHSTFSRAGAEALTQLTGSPWFPGGLGEFVAKKDSYLFFEKGPSVDVHLQWASYYDAADQAGQSRLWGGIHVQPDDFVGRRIGSEIGNDSVALAKTYFDGTAK
jgi:hypothetical protein